MFGEKTKKNLLFSNDNENEELLLLEELPVENSHKGHKLMGLLKVDDSGRLLLTDGQDSVGVALAKRHKHNR